jgi:hypothetical protein
MAPPIVIDGTTSIITVNTMQLVSPIIVQIPIINLRGRLIKIVDTGGMAHINTITVQCIGGAQFDDGRTTILINTKNGSICFGQKSSSIFVLSQTRIRGNIETAIPRIIISTPFTFFSTITSRSSMIVYNNLSASNLKLGGTVLALGGFKPSGLDSNVIMDYLSAITISTGIMRVGTVITGGGITTADTYVSSVRVSSSYNTVSLDSYRETVAQSTFINSLLINGNSFYASNGNLFLNNYQINNDTSFLIPQFASSISGLMSTINIGTGVSSLSTTVGLISVRYNPNPGFSSISTYIAERLTLIGGADTNSLFEQVTTSLSTTNAISGLSSLSSIISYGLSSIAIPFSLSSLLITVQIGISSVNELRSISTLTADFQHGISSANQNTGIDPIINTTKSLLSSTDSSVLFSTVSTNLGYGYCNLNLSNYISSFYGSVSTSFCNLVIENTLSSFSSILANVLHNVNFYSSVSSLSTTIGYGFSSIDIRRQISTLSTTIVQGLSSVTSFSREMSSLSTVVVLQISSLSNLVLSSLLNDLSMGSSIVFAGYGLSSFSQYQSSHFYNMRASPGLSSLSTILVEGINTVVGNINPPSFIYFSTLLTSSIAMSNTRLGSGTLLVNNTIFTVNNHAVTPPNNNFETASSISTYSVFVGSTFTSFSSLYPSSLAMQSLRTSSILSRAHLAESTLTTILNLKDAVTTQIHEFTINNVKDFLYDRITLFYNEYSGLSSLSSIVGPSLSSISNYVASMNAISSGLSTLALALPRICTLSTLYAYKYEPDYTGQDVSTVSSFISTLWTSTLIVNYMNLNSTIVDSVETSSFSAYNINSFSMEDPFSFFIESSLNVEQSYISTFDIGIEISSISTVSLEYDILDTQTLITDHFYASSVNTDIVTGGTVYLKDNSASYTDDIQPLENNTFYQLRAEEGILKYNSTIYNGVSFDSNVVSDFVSTNSLTVESILTGTIYTSSLTFSGKVQFDRLVVRQSTVTPYFYVTQSGVYNLFNFNQDTLYFYGFLFRSLDGITWQKTDPNADTSWVGKKHDAGYGGSSGYSLAWNGNTMIAYADNNTDIRYMYPFFIGYGIDPVSNVNASGMYSNAISYDGGFTWSNIPRFAPDESRAIVSNPDIDGMVQVKIIWAFDKWWRFQSASYPSPSDSISYTSSDGIIWARNKWLGTENLEEYTENPFITTTDGTGQQTLYNVCFNGTTMILSEANNTNFGGSNRDNYLANGCVRFTEDGVVSLPMVNGNGGTVGTIFEDINLTVKSNPWSDGHAWWFPNSVGPYDRATAMARVYPWTNDYSTEGVKGESNVLNQGTRALVYCTGVGMAFNYDTVPYVITGYYNGYMHVCGRGQEDATSSNLSSLTLIYSYDGMTWFPNNSVKGTHGTVIEVLYANNKWIVSANGNSDGINTEMRYSAGPGLFYSLDGLNWNVCLGEIPLCSTYISGQENIGGRGGGGARGLMYMSNTTPSIDFNGIRIYNQPNGLGWNNPVTREQSIIAAQSSILLHNTLTINTDISPESCSTNNVTRVGILNLNPRTTLDMGMAGTITAERLVTSSMYVSTSSSLSLPLSSFNLYVNGGSFLQNLALNVPKPVTVLDISGANALFRSEGNENTATDAYTYLTDYTGDNTILGPSMLANSTAMTLYYKSGGTVYRRSYGGSNFFTGQHASICLDISGAMVSSIVSTMVTDKDGKDEISFSTVWTDYSGYLLSSADDGYVSIPSCNVRLIGADAITIIEALPKTRITRKQRDPAVFGVVTNNANASYKENGSVQLDSDSEWANDLWGRVRVNSIGEGAIWVTNINGNITNGDYLCSSEIAGHAEKQDDDYMYNYTVAKATISCSFDLSSSKYRCEEIAYNGSTFLRSYIGCTYHCG